MGQLSYFDRWIKDAASPRLRPRTLVGDKQIVNSHLNPALGAIQAKHLAVQHVQVLIGAKVEEVFTSAQAREFVTAAEGYRLGGAVYRCAIGRVALRRSPWPAMDLR